MFKAVQCLLLSLCLFSGLSHAGPSRPFEILTSLTDAKVVRGNTAENLAAQNFFARFHGLNMTEGYFKSDPKESDFGKSPVYFTRLVGGSEPQDCPAIFCRDKAFFERVMAEANSGRLLLLTHAFNDYSGLTFDGFGTVFALKRTFPGINLEKAIVVLTPTLTIYGLEHELVHAVDFEQGLTEPLEDWVEKMSEKYRWKESLRDSVLEIVAELRAYDKERRLILASTRETEWTTVHDRKDSEVIKIVETSGRDFVTEESKRLELYAHEYVVSFFKAIRGIKGQPRRELLNEMAKYLPVDGPFSMAAIERGPTRYGLNSPRY